VTGASSGKRRSKAGLEEELGRADSDSKRASAHFELAVFHDNKGREGEAIPHYEAALELGLPDESIAQCLAWLASSLHKAGRPQEAMERLQQAKQRTNDRELMGFLHRLDGRVRLKSIPSARESRRS
jgi:tetratricopeptide (TPR) repeat protein